MKADYQIGIIGAGFSGLVAALRLKKQHNNSFVIFERAAEVGGTWRDNVYPGCAVDISSPLYCFSDEPNANWSHLFSPQPEILDYIKSVVDKNDLRKHIRFGADIIKAEFDETNVLWKVTDSKGNSITVKILLGGLGPLNRASIPNFEGLENFKGEYFHSSHWNSNCDLTGKKVAVIGTGASAIQIVPNIADKVKSLHLFQRTPAWITHRFDVKFSEKTMRRFNKFPFLLKALREFQFWFNEFFGLGFIGYKSVNKLMRWSALKKLEKEVKDEETRKKLTPTYAIGCKRILKSDDFYLTFNRENVHLITENITKFNQTGILTADGIQHDFDVVVFATGFHVADMNYPIRVIGKNGKELFATLKQTGGEAFKGITVPGFPNLAFILGPNTGLGHNSVVHIMESQMNYIMGYIHHIENLPTNAYADVKPLEVEKYNKKIQSQFRGTVWESGCNSWYLNDQGKNNTLYPRLNTHYRKITKKFNPNDYIIGR